jgi:hypothetical protein
VVEEAPLFDIAAIMAAIRDVQEGMVGPSGEKPLQFATDKLTSAITTFPAFVNLVTSGDDLNPPGAGVSNWQGELNVTMVLLFAPNGGKYSQSACEAWVPIVIRAFNRAVRLRGVVPLARLVRFSLRPSDAPSDFGLDQYISATFELLIGIKVAEDYQA